MSSSTSTTERKVIFLIDDDPDFLEIFGAKLTSAGFSVIPFQSPKKAIEEAAVKHPSLILLDVQIPEMNGIQTLSGLKSDPKTADIKVVFLTNTGTNEPGMEWIDQKFAKDVGAVGHIRKSDDLDKILAQIIHALEQQ